MISLWAIKVICCGQPYLVCESEDGKLCLNIDIPGKIKAYHTRESAVRAAYELGGDAVEFREVESAAADTGDAEERKAAGQ